MFFGLFKNNKEPKPITIIGKYEGSHPKFSHSVFNTNPKCDEDGVDLSFNKGRRFLAKHLAGAAVKKKKYDSGFYIQNTICTKNDNVELLEKRYSNTEPMETTVTSLENISHASKSTKFKKCVLARLSLEPAK